MHFRHHGRANSMLVAFVASAALFAGLLAWLSLDRRKSTPHANPLLMYCAVSIKAPVEATMKQYEQETGIKIELQYNASQTLLTNAVVSHRGDLYLPADDSYIATARQKGVLGEETLLAIQRPVLAVKKGNPLNIRSLDDLLRPEVRLAQANPDAAAIGKVTRDILSRTGRWDTLQKHTLVFTGTVSDAANNVKIGSADAAFIWDAMAKQYADLEVIQLPELAGAESKIIVGVLKSTDQPEAARNFARYLAAPNKGLAHFKRLGFSVVEGTSR